MCAPAATASCCCRWGWSPSPCSRSASRPSRSIPSITLAAAFAFAAVIAPTDAIAVTAIAGRLGLPRRVVTILEGESLLNDATALVALNASIARDRERRLPRRDRAGLRDRRRGRRRAWASSTGLRRLVGALAAALGGARHQPDAGHPVRGIPARSAAARLRRAGGRDRRALPGLPRPRGLVGRGTGGRAAQLAHDPVPARERRVPVHRPEPQGDPRGRPQHRTGTSGRPWSSASASCSLSSLSRFAWVMGTTLLYRKGPQRLRERSWPWRNGIAVSAAGVRGVVTLAAVFLLPPETPSREYLQFLAFVVVVASPARRAGAPGDHPHAEAPPAQLRSGAHRAASPDGRGAAGGHRSAWTRSRSRTTSSASPICCAPTPASSVRRSTRTVRPPRSRSSS